MKRALRRFKISRNFETGVLVGLLFLSLINYGGRRLISAIQLRSEENRSLYALGQIYGHRVEAMNFSKDEAEWIVEGFQDRLKDKDRVNSLANPDQMQKFLTDRLKNHIFQAKKDGDDYLRKYVQSGGMHTLSGLAYRIVSSGSAKKPSPKDWVEVRYQGRLINGKIVDGTNEGGDTEKFPLNGVIPGWTEGLQLLGEGGEIELVVPSSLAYGDSENAAGVPPGSTLIFKIQLVRVIEDGKKAGN